MSPPTLIISLIVMGTLFIVFVNRIPPHPKKDVSAQKEPHKPNYKYIEH